MQAHFKFTVILKFLLTFLIILIALAGCYGVQGKQIRYSSSVVQYLYPKNDNIAVEPSIPVLSLPLRVGIAFVPEAGTKPGQQNLSEARKLDLLEQVAAEFRKHPFIKSLEIIPSAYLMPKGGFTNVDQIGNMYGIDVIALVSYDQVQHTDEGLLSLSYWTIIGAYVIKGEKNDTSTMMDTAVYHIPSHKLLFRAPGTSHIKGTATLVNLSEQLRRDSDDGFVAANNSMKTNLVTQLEAFKEKVKASPQDYRVEHRPEYTGRGSLDFLATSLVFLLGGLALYRERRKSR